MKFKEHFAEILMFMVFVTMILLLIFKILLEFQDQRDSDIKRVHIPSKKEIYQHSLDGSN